MKKTPINSGYIPSYANCGEDDFRIFVSNTIDYAIYLIDAQGLVKTWNKGASCITGYNADEIVGKPISIIYIKEDLQNGAFARNLARAKEQGSFKSEGWRVRKDGTLFLANALFTATYNKQQQLTGFAIITKDISDQKKITDDLALVTRETVEKLKHSESRLRQAQAVAHLGSWEINFSTGIALWSEESLRIYGLPKEDSEQSYESWLSFIHPGDKDRVMQIIKEGEASLNNFGFFHRIVRRNGEVRHLHSQVCFEFNKDAEPVGLYGVAHDITEMKVAEESLKESERLSKELHAFNQKLI
jgi:PAS domain S-box-containing protein